VKEFATENDEDEYEFAASTTTKGPSADAFQRAAAGMKGRVLAALQAIVADLPTQMSGGA